MTLPRKRIFLGTAVFVVSYFLLMLPGQTPEIPPSPATELARPFLWNQDAYWDSLETNFVRARQLGCGTISILVEAALGQLRERVGLLHAHQFVPNAPIFAEMEQQIFLLGPWIGSCPERLPEYIQLVSDVRDIVKHQSLTWDMNDRGVRETLYRLLYGGRMAVEEVMLQAPPDLRLPALTKGCAEPSSTPRGMLRDLEVHSGDILVSRGGAPTSALIARGNDFPGNFSHIALVHVDETTRRVSIIESHIERGVAISSPEEYFRDTKLRVMVMRLRSSLPCMTADSLLPHRAASYALERARGRHIPYDFAMDFRSNERLFCSEVVSEAYNRRGVALWMGLSHITSSGLRRWLADFGVRHFETQEPSDLEYDPQLSVVAEWRDVAWNKPTRDWRSHMIRGSCRSVASSRGIQLC
jgi:hypothetical protein